MLYLTLKIVGKSTKRVDSRYWRETCSFKIKTEGKMTAKILGVLVGVLLILAALAYCIGSSSWLAALVLAGIAMIAYTLITK